MTGAGGGLCCAHTKVGGTKADGNRTSSRTNTRFMEDKVDLSQAIIAVP